jgi:CheY-like chemotaxis protein
MAMYREGQFGNCPICGRTDGYLNISCNHWFVCHEHKTKWFVGSSLFSDWQFESEIDWLGNAVLLGQYRDVTPTESKQHIPVSTGKEKECANLQSLNQRLKEAVEKTDFPALRRVAEECLKTADVCMKNPGQPESDAVPDRDKAYSRKRQNGLTYRRILVVDDEPMIRDSCTRIFRERDYWVEVASSATEGLEHSMRSTFDCALIDLKLPDMDGLKLIRSARKYNRNMAILIITGYGTAESAAEAKRLGVSDYIQKPFTPEDLVTAVEHALQGNGNKERCVFESNN